MSGAVDLRSTARIGLFTLWRDEGSEAWIEADGTSMLPLIQPGSSILVAFGARPQGVGEIAVLSRGVQVVCHRVIALAGDGATVVTKGDAEPQADAPVPVSDVLGMVRAVRHADGASDSRRSIGGPLGWAVALASRFGDRVDRVGRRLARGGGRNRRIGWGLVRVGRWPVRLLLALMARGSRVSRAERG